MKLKAKNISVLDEALKIFKLNEFVEIFEKFTGISISMTVINPKHELEFWLYDETTPEEMNKVNEFGFVETP